MHLIELFWSFLQVGAFAIGGGYATIPLIKDFIIDKHHWINIGEFSNMITISQMTPGPLAINLATFVGKKTGGFTGSVLATIGCVLTGVLISVAIYKFFNKFKDSESISYMLKGLRSSTTGLIASACSMVVVLAFFRNGDFSQFSYPALILFVICLILLRKFKLNMILIICFAGIVGLFIA